MQKLKSIIRMKLRKTAIIYPLKRIIILFTDHALFQLLHQLVRVLLEGASRVETSDLLIHAGDERTNSVVSL